VAVANTGGDTRERNRRGVAAFLRRGGSARQATQDFRKGLLDQVAAIDGDPRGLGHLPLYITEWNRGAQIGNLADEAISAEFARRAFRFLDRWNRTPGNHNIVASTWFVYDGGNGSGAWDTYSIEYWKNNGNATSSPNSLYNAFFTSARTDTRRASGGPSRYREACDCLMTSKRRTGTSPAPVSATPGEPRRKLRRLVQGPAE
jgi:hypothetical protein